MNTQRLEMEAITEEHADYLFPVLLDEKIYAYIDEQQICDRNQLKKRYMFLSKGAPTSSGEIWLNWAIKLKSQNIYIGTLQSTIYENKHAEIAYVISPEFWRKGYASEAVRELCVLLFQEFQVVEIVISVDVNNEASIRLAEKLGFHRFETVDCSLKGKPAREHHYCLEHN
jgi:ribosomal-protein-alanine N-acetyltransferase